MGGGRAALPPRPPLLLNYLWRLLLAASAPAAGGFAEGPPAKASQAPLQMLPAGQGTTTHCRCRRSTPAGQAGVCRVPRSQRRLSLQLGGQLLPQPLIALTQHAQPHAANLLRQGMGWVGWGGVQQRETRQPRRTQNRNTETHAAGREGRGPTEWTEC